MIFLEDTAHHLSVLLGPCLLWPRSPISATAELLSCCLLLDLTILSISQIGFTHLVCLTACHTPSLQLSVVVADSFGPLPYTPRGNVFRSVFVRTALLNSQNSVRLTAV